VEGDDSTYEVSAQQQKFVHHPQQPQERKTAESSQDQLVKFNFQLDTGDNLLRKDLFVLCPTKQ
jgi:hypothetical protein